MTDDTNPAVRAEPCPHGVTVGPCGACFAESVRKGYPPAPLPLEAASEPLGPWTEADGAAIRREVAENRGESVPLEAAGTTPPCLCVVAVPGATRESMATPGPQHDQRCPKFQAAEVTPLPGSVPHHDAAGRVKHYCTRDFCPDFADGNAMVAAPAPRETAAETTGGARCLHEHHNPTCLGCMQDALDGAQRQIETARAESSALRRELAAMTKERDAYAQRWRDVTRECDAALRALGGILPIAVSAHNPDDPDNAWHGQDCTVCIAVRAALEAHHV